MQYIEKRQHIKIISNRKEFKTNHKRYFIITFLLITCLWINTTGCGIISTPGVIIKSDYDELQKKQISQKFDSQELLTYFPNLVNIKFNLPQGGSFDLVNSDPYQEDTINIYLPIIYKFSAFYVSLDGDNTDGKSWETAWSELDQIRWDLVNPGDTIFIDGGEYHTNLDVGKSGGPGTPIKITTNGEQVVLNGQRPALPYCGQANYIQPTTGHDGIDLEGRRYIVIDGRDWRGIIIRNHKTGIRIRENASNIIVRNVEIHSNGWVNGTGLNTEPDGPGVDLGGSNILFERVIIHDNGQDAFQVGWGVWNFSLRKSWLYNSREHPNKKGLPFNYCSHMDGIQIYGGGIQGPITIEDSIIGPSFTQGMMINNTVDVDNSIVKNTLIVGNANAGIVIQESGGSSNWTLQNVTIVSDVLERSWNINLRGNSHRIRNSIFWDGPWGIGIWNWAEASNNINWLTPDANNIAVEANPMFVDSVYNAFQDENFSDFDFKVQNPNFSTLIGSSITSVERLFTFP